MQRFEGKIAVITGGSSGIGLASAQKIVEEGGFVFITGRRQAELDKAVSLIGKNVTAVQGDIASLDDLDQLYRTVKAEKGALDIVIANAGCSSLVRLADATPAHFDEMFNVNARGTFFTVQKALPLLRDGGSVVLIGSVAHVRGVAQLTAYSGAKAAVRSFARSWAADLKERNIRVNCLSPGGVDTPIIDLQMPTKEGADEMRKYMVAGVPLGRLGTADELAKAVLFLASDDSSYCTGIDLQVDGGAVQV